MLACWSIAQPAAAQTEVKRVHVIVALVDNDSQGVVPVPAQLGDGNDPAHNLYWGALYGLKTFFNRDPDWTRSETPNPSHADILDAVRFDWTSEDESVRVELTAEAWRGAEMSSAINAFYVRLSDSSDTDMVVFIGHNGLMDFHTDIVPPISVASTTSKDVVILACHSDSYFRGPLAATNAGKRVTTFGLMAPEAYSLMPAIEIWAMGGSQDEMRLAAASGYAEYQKIPLSNAKRLFGVR